MSETDLQLLTRYTQYRAEDAFAEVVRRHIDLVYSAALRQVCSPQLAEEIAQSAFTDLARNVSRLAPDTIVTAWLYEVTRRTAIDVVRRETRRQLREQIATELNTMNATASDWTQIEPLLDEAVHALDQTDRAAVLLRYFENKSLREVGEQLGVSDDAAQKRVSRALEKLRENLSRRGVTATAAVLTVLISANAVHAAPAGIAVTISTAAFTGTTLAATATTTATKVIAMTTLQKTIIAVVIMTGIATPFAIKHAAQTKLHEENARLLTQNQSLQEQVSNLTQIAAENVRMSNLLAGVGSTSAVRTDPSREVLRLRSEIGRLRTDAMTNAKPADAASLLLRSDTMMESIQNFNRALYSSMVDKYYGEIFKAMKLTPSQAANLKELLVKLSLKQAEQGIATVAGDLDNPDRAEIAKKFAKEEQAITDQIKELLGDHFTQFSEFESTIRDRARLENFKDQLATTSTPLQADQEKQLASTLFELQKSFKFSDDYSDESKIKADPDSYLSGQKWNQLLQEAEQFRQVYVTRAKEFLSAEQVDAFDKYVANELRLQTAEAQIRVKKLLANKN